MSSEIGIWHAILTSKLGCVGVGVKKTDVAFMVLLCICKFNVSLHTKTIDFFFLSGRVWQKLWFRAEKKLRKESGNGEIHCYHIQTVVSNWHKSMYASATFSFTKRSSFCVTGCTISRSSVIMPCTFLFCMLLS